MPDVAIRTITGNDVTLAGITTTTLPNGQRDTILDIIPTDEVATPSGFIALYDDRFDDPTYYTA